MFLSVLIKYAIHKTVFDKIRGYESCLKSFESQHENGNTHQNPFWYYNCTTFCKILVKIVAILDAQLLFESHLC